MIAMQKRSPLISATELGELMNKQSLVLIDARTGPDARERYKAAHPEGALYVDMETDLAKKGPDPSQGGRHPLPPVTDFAALLGRLGIDPSSHVVVYDDKGGANAAARFWWMLKSLGHEKVQVLDGGLNAALQAGFQVTDKISNPQSLPAYPAVKWILPTANAEMVAEATANSDYLVIDVREAFRYKGESEPIDTIAGHIPGAVNIPYTGNLNAGGNFLSPDELKKKYQQAMEGRKAQDVIVHCGSGVTACHTLLAMDQAGLEIPQLYVGSWSEWSRNDRPVAVGEQV
jgi:thiosulfate/3-mercaptopyruvate sulfurtransferase